MAEALVIAQASHLESFPPNERNKWTKARKAMYARRNRIGDISVIRPDGWQWGAKERLPYFVVIKVPEITYEQAKAYEDRVRGTIDSAGNSEIIHKHRFAVPESFVQNMIDLGQDSVTVSLSDFNTNRIDKL